MIKGSYCFTFNGVRKRSELDELMAAASIFASHTYLTEKPYENRRPLGTAETIMSGNDISGYDLCIRYLVPYSSLEIEPDKRNKIEISTSTSGLELRIEGKRFRPCIVSKLSDSAP